MQQQTIFGSGTRQVGIDALRKIAQAKPGGIRHPNMRDGSYVLEVRLCDLFKGQKGRIFLIETGVVEARQITDGIQPNAPGTVIGTATNIDTNLSAGGNSLRFMLALYGIVQEEMAHTGQPDCCGIPQGCGKPAGQLLSETEREDEFVAVGGMIIAPGQPAKGMLINCTTYRSKIQTGPNAGKDFVGQGWEHYPGQSAQQVSERRAAIDRGMIGAALQTQAVPY